MQVLKDEVREKIIEVALLEFAHKGFQNASMRNISKNAGMTVGNLYRYFNDKGDLFYTIVNPTYERLMLLTKESVEFYKDEAHLEYIEYITDKLFKIYNEFRGEFIILFEGSSGTKYENAKAEIICLVRDILKEFLVPVFSKKGVVIEDAFLFHIIASGFIEGLIMIAMQYEDEATTMKVVSQFITFYFGNVYKRFG